jgi:EpsI family protein
MLTTALGLSKLSESKPPAELAFPLEAIPASVEGWTLMGSEKLEQWVIESITPTSYLSRTYGKGSGRLGLFIAFYAQQKSGEGAHSPRNCLPGNGWEIRSRETIDIPVNGSSVQVNCHVIQKDQVRSTVLYWYQSKRRIVANEYLGKLFLVRDSLLEGRTEDSLVRITVNDQPGALEEGKLFASAVIPQMQRCLGR